MTNEAPEQSPDEIPEVFTWDESCRVGVEAFDGAHRHLFELGNRMIAAVVQRHGVEVSGPIIDELIEYAEAHFAREEEVMANTGFHGLEAHQQAHKRLLNDALLFKSQFIAGNVDPSAVATFLINWIVVHIKEVDMQYSEHLQKQGIT